MQMTFQRKQPRLRVQQKWENLGGMESDSLRGVGGPQPRPVPARRPALPARRRAVGPRGVGAELICSMESSAQASTAGPLLHGSGQQNSIFLARKKKQPKKTQTKTASNLSTS